MWTTSAAKCTEGFVRKDLQLSVQIRTVVCKELNKTQFYGRSPYTGGEPHISCVVVVHFSLFLLCFYAFDK